MSKYDFANEFLKSDKVNILYNDGSVFLGEVYPIFKGVHRFTNGEIFEGEFKEIRYVNNVMFAHTGIYAPYKGKTTFANGTVVEGDWLEKYDFTKEEFEQIFPNTKSLTDMRDNLVGIRTEKQRKLQAENEYMEMLIKEVESVLDCDYYSNNCPSVEELGKLRSKLEKLEKELPMDFSNMSKKSYLLELQSSLSKAIITQVMTKKYSVATAKKIMAGKYEIVMSKEIVEEIMGTNKFYYKKSISTISGKQIEMWDFDYNAEALRIFDLKVKNNLKAECPTLIFSNGKLTDIIR